MSSYELDNLYYKPGNTTSEKLRWAVASKLHISIGWILIKT
jgi:hypothetical protein